MSYAPALRTSPLGTWEHDGKSAAPPSALAAARALIAGICIAGLFWRGNVGGTTSLLLGGLVLYGACCAGIAFLMRQRPSSADTCRPLVRGLDVCAIALFGLTAMTALRRVTVVYPLVVATAGTLFTWWQHRRRDVIDTASAATRLIGSLRVELGVHGVLRAALAELVRLADARAAVLALEHGATRRLRLVVLAGSGRDGADVRICRIRRNFRDTYFFDAPAAVRRPRRAQRTPTAATVQVLALGRRGAPIPPRFHAAHPFRGLYGFAFRLGDDWNGRLFLLDPSSRGSREDVHLIGDLLEELVPAVAGICDLQAVWRRAAASERARLGRELHDGIVQELFAIELELELLRHSALGEAHVASQLEHVQQRLQTELSNLRQLMQRARSHQLDPTRLPQVLHDLVEHFARESGIAARFVCESDRIELAGDVCGELARIVQEALVNVRRHSHARHVLVRFGCEGREWRLSVQDDGCGFQAWVPGPRDAGRPVVRAPAVISERVRALGGSLRLASSLEGGACLEISSRG